MPGPNSAPNGDIALTLAHKDHCPIHGLDLSKCHAESPKGKRCPRVTLRAFRASRNTLRTGKTARKRG